MKYRMIEKDPFTIVGIKRKFLLVNGENLDGIPKLWDEVNANGTSERLYHLNNGNIKGVLGVCVANSNQHSDEMDYWVAAEFEGEVPQGLYHLKIPSSKWAVFEVRGAMPHAMQNAWKQIFTEWFPTSGYRHAASPEMEVYPKGDPSGDDYYSEIWIPVL
ncbi:AraC family transcriptional regulator [Bacillus salipaludis]|uniref:AraC family transcriptional regulator n=1 Tax=Bacillus salipaludis TaxID=2547811 RepID=A0A4R5VVN3_9BACI|nr:GyrI-like domain-containing protein [Bacillus salipaludis]TDK63279.1 AraC family transcriptional regulator [Bacillus salipaludis]